MKNSIKTRILFLQIVFVFSFIPALSAFGNTYDERARLLIQTAGRSGGICIFPECGDGKLAMAIAANSSLLVYATSEDVSGARAAVLTTGKLNRTVYFESQRGYTSALADWSADLMLVLEATGSDLNDALAQELYRVLSPWRGVALVGTGGAGDISSFKNKCLALGMECTDITGVDGVSLKVIKPKETGMDSKSHYLGNASNNPVSTDTLLKAPFLLQYMSSPFVSPGGGWLLAGGRLYEAIGQTYRSDNTKDLCGSLWCRNAYNGRILWQDKLPATVDPVRPIWAATDNHLYIMHDTFPQVRKINGETGITEYIAFPHTSGQVKWVAINNNILYVLIGNVAPPVKAFYKTDITGKPRATIRENKLHHGRYLYAYDLVSNTIAWSHYENDALIDCRAIGIHDNKIYFFSELTDFSKDSEKLFEGKETVRGYRLACLNSSTGGSIWSNNAIELNPLTRNYQYIFGREWIPGLNCSSDGISLRLSGIGVQDILMFDPLSGAFRWKKPFSISGSSWGYGFVKDGNYFYAKNMYDVNTGLKTGTPSQWGGGCGIRSCSPNGIFGNFTSGFKADCHQGSYAAGGLLTVPRGWCECNDNWRGSVSLSHSKNIDISVAPTSANLQNVNYNTGGELIPDTLDWPVYRRDNNRCAASKTNIPSKVSLAWTYNNASPFSFISTRNTFRMQRQDQPTEPVAVGQRVYIGGSDGVVKCINASDGTELWSFASAGKIYASPTVDNSRVYVGSFDGYVYCLSAINGSLLWKYRAAPYDQRIVVSDELTSRWPVMGGVLVHDGKAFFVAGQMGEFGIHVYAVDAVSGELKWHNGSSGPKTDIQPSFSPDGYMTILNNLLMVKGRSGWPAAFDITSGTRTNPWPAYANDNIKGNWLSNSNAPVHHGTIGREIVNLGNGFILMGGRYLQHELNQTEGDRGHEGFIIQQFDNLGQDPKRVVVRIASESIIAPAHDDSGIAIVPGGASGGLHGLAYLKKPEMMQTISGIIEPGYADTKNPTIWKNLLGTNNGPAGMTELTGLSSEYLWGTGAGPVFINALVLAPNAVVVITGTTSWKLQAYSRSNGTMMWEQSLPAEPMLNGLCINRDGKVLVTMRNGSVLCYAATVSGENYTLTVNNGTGSGTFTAGKVVNIEANKPLPEMEFDKWTGETAGVTDVNASSTTFTMPQSNANITATYRVSTSLDELNYQVGIYPNPSKGRFVIRATQPVTLVKIFNASGTLIYINNRYEVNSEIEIDTEQPEGTIMVEVTLQNGHKKVEKVIISKKH